MEVHVGATLGALKRTLKRTHLFTTNSTLGHPDSSRMCPCVNTARSDEEAAREETLSEHGNVSSRRVR